MLSPFSILLVTILAVHEKLGPLFHLAKLCVSSENY